MAPQRDEIFKQNFNAIRSWSFQNICNEIGWPRFFCATLYDCSCKFPDKQGRWSSLKTQYWFACPIKFVLFLFSYYIIFTFKIQNSGLWYILRIRVYQKKSNFSYLPQKYQKLRKKLLVHISPIIRILFEIHDAILSHLAQSGTS